MRGPYLALAAVLGGVSAASLGCDGHTSPVEPSPVCAIAITPASQGFTEEGGTSTVTVAAAAGCAWTAASTADWVAIASAATGVGPGSVVYTVRPNGGVEPRTAALTVESRRHTVTQSGRTPLPCTFALAPPGIDAGKDAVDGTFAVSAPAGCAWTASSNAPWLTVTAGSPAAGPGRVSYAIARNTNFAARDAVIIVADQTFAVHQAGDPGVPRGLDGTWNGRLIDYPAAGPSR
jgi:hypothetical protein